MRLILSLLAKDSYQEFMVTTSIDFITIFIFSGIFLIIFAIAEALYHLFEVDVAYTRKFVHVMTGIIVMFFPIYFKNPISLVIICVCFFVALALSKRLGLMKSINAIERSSQGSTLYPLVVIICYFVQFYLGKYIYFLIPILILALADPAAEFFGKRFGYKPYSIFKHKKTISGSIGFFVIALITSLSGLFYLGDLSVILMVVCAVSVALFTTLGEAISIKGYDNLVIPLCAVLVLYLFGI